MSPPNHNGWQGRDINIIFPCSPTEHLLSQQPPPPQQPPNPTPILSSAPSVVSLAGAGATAHSSPTLMRGDRTGRFTRPLQWRWGHSQSCTQTAGGHWRRRGVGGGCRAQTAKREQVELKLTGSAEQLNVTNYSQSSEHTQPVKVLFCDIRGFFNSFMCYLWYQVCVVQYVSIYNIAYISANVLYSPNSFC